MSKSSVATADLRTNLVLPIVVALIASSVGGIVSYTFGVQAAQATMQTTVDHLVETVIPQLAADIREDPYRGRDARRDLEHLNKLMAAEFEKRDQVLQNLVVITSAIRADLKADARTIHELEMWAATQGYQTERKE